ncbi:hypothetical protein [Winogradskyella sp. PC D3.3]
MNTIYKQILILFSSLFISIGSASDKNLAHKNHFIVFKTYSKGKNYADTKRQHTIAIPEHVLIKKYTYNFLRPHFPLVELNNEANIEDLN